MRWGVAAVLAFALSASDSSRASAQAGLGGGALSEGVRVRVTLQGTRIPVRVGTFEGVRDDSLLVSSRADRPDAIALSDVTNLEVSTGRSRRTVPGAAIGLVGGLGVIGMRALAESPCGASVDDACLIPGAPGILPGVHVGVVVGVAMVLGAVIGTVIQSDEWQSVLWSPAGHGSVPLAELDRTALVLGWRVRTR